MLSRPPAADIALCAMSAANPYFVMRLLTQIYTFARGRTVVDLACFFGWLMVVLPSVTYLWTDWKRRRQRILSFLTPASLKIYYQQFLPVIDVSADTDPQLKDRFEKHYDCCYGRRHFIVPLILLAFVSGLALLGTALSVDSWQLSLPMTPLPDVAVSASLGALTWVLADELGRVRSDNFSPGDLYNSVLRFLVAVPFGYAFRPLVKDLGVPLAFLLGAFPTGTLMTMARRLVGQKLGLGEEDQTGKLELERLQNIGKPNAERFSAEGVTTIAELAWNDPVDLAVQTNFDFNYVVDCMSQALVWIYFEEKMKNLYQFSIRGAQEVAALVNNLQSTNASERDAAAQALSDVAKAMGMDQGAVYHTLLQVRDDPYTKFLLEIWH